jgi:putative ABC transport system permease protein
MVVNYLKMAWRVMKKQKFYAFINIGGLALGLAVCIIILLYVQDEVSYDRFHQNLDRIYRLERLYYQPDGSIGGSLSSLAPSFTPFLEQDFPEIEHIARVFHAQATGVAVDEKHFTEERFFLAEHDIFAILTLPLLEGDTATALKEPGTLVISSTAARKYFGDEDPMGRSLKVDGRFMFKITGVMEDLPFNSHIHFDFLGSYISLKGIYGQGDNDYFWGVNNFTDNVVYTYARLAPGKEGAALEARIPAFADRHMPIHTTDDGRIVKGSRHSGIRFRRVKDIHLYSHTAKEAEVNGDIFYVITFSIVALFVLLIACFNFINLATARASTRAREVGMRKVSGANRRSLITQFIGESVLISFVAMVAALVLVRLLLPHLRSLTGLAFRFEPLQNPLTPILILVAFVLTGLAAGIYPAFYLSAFQPARILRGEKTRGSGGAAMRKGLVVVQFAISVALMICVGLVYKQTRFMVDTDLGFKKENVLLFPADSDIVTRWREIKMNLLRDPRIVSATLSKRAPAGRLLDAPGFEAEVDGEKVRNPFSMPHNRVDYDFFKTYGMEIVAGRDFSQEFATDAASAYILNETAVRRFGLKNPRSAIGLNLTVPGREPGRVVGVVKDFNYESLHNTIPAIVTYLAPNQANTAALRIVPGDIAEITGYIGEVIGQYKPGFQLNHTFMDERLAMQYKNEAVMIQLFGYFCLFAVFIAGLGLVGLAAFTADRRTKEIVIRKVLGASVGQVTMLLSVDFVKWALAANLIGAPIAALLMNKWLAGFAYRTDLGVAVFALTAVISVGIALATVVIQAWKTAVINPARGLRYE